MSANAVLQPWRLLTQRRFAPMFAAQFLGAFNDNLFKQALIITLAFQAGASSGSDAAAAASSGLYILPFFLLSAFSGDLSDRMDKATLFTRLKLLEIALMGLALLGFALGSILILLTALFLMGAQSSFFAPLKFGLLTERVDEGDLTAGTAMLGGSTYVAILSGVTAGGLLAALPAGGMKAAGAGIVAAVLGWLSARVIERNDPADPARKPDLVLPRGVWRLLSEILNEPALRRTALAIMWFWSFGTLMMVLTPFFVRDALGGDEISATWLIVLFAIGIALGALLTNIVNRGRPLLRASYIGACGIVALPAVTALLAVGPPINGQIFTTAAGLMVTASLVALAVSGGLFVVPLQTRLQLDAPAGRRGRVFGALNALNAIGAAIASLIGMVVLALDLKLAAAFIGASVLNALLGALVIPALRRSKDPLHP